MGVVFEMEGARERIINGALALSGMEMNERVDALFDVALLNALAYCNRDDVPYKMEGALALILADMMRNGGEKGVKSMTRGDVSVTYSDKDNVKGELGSFVRMRAI